MDGQKSMKLERITPTIGLNIAKLDKDRKGEYVFWDVGGQEVLRKIWEKYFNEANGLIYVIDGADDMRFNEVKETL
jgi:ADP-ribosylation factor related protein 1